MKSRLLMVLMMVVAVVGLGCSKAEVKDNGDGSYNVTYHAKR